MKKNKNMTSDYGHVKCLLSGILLVSSGLLFSQTGNVGINTPKPQKTLHVNGSLQVTKEINLGGTSSTAGSAGLTNQVLVSQGAGNPAVWKNVDDLIAPNLYTLQLFKEKTTTQVSFPSSLVNTSLVLGTVSGVNITKPTNIVVLYLDIDTYCYQLFNQSAIAYNFVTNVTQGGVEIDQQTSPVLILSGSLFNDSRNGNFRAFVYRNLPVGTIDIGVFGRRQNSAGPNGNKNLEFIPGNMHVYLYESN